MRNAVSLTLISFFMASAAFAEVVAAPDKKGTKLQIVSVANPAMDCKVSLKEIAKFTAAAAEDFLCKEFENKESTMQYLVTGMAEGHLTANYYGASADSVILLLNSWKDAVVAKAQALPEAERAAVIAANAPFSFRVLGQTGNVADIMADNANGPAYTLKINMNQVKPE